MYTLKMKNTILLLLVFLITACNSSDEVTALSKLGDGERVWAYMQFNIPEEDDKIDSYYYFGEVSEQLYELISSNQINQGFISLNNVKYWGDNDRIIDYADDEYSGNLVFRIENIERIEKMNGEPVFNNEADVEQAETNETETIETESGEETQEQSAEQRPKLIENNISSPND